MRAVFPTIRKAFCSKLGLHTSSMLMHTVVRTDLFLPTGYFLWNPTTNLAAVVPAGRDPVRNCLNHCTPRCSASMLYDAAT
ncbi:hypothetical protein NSPZN2_110059 [Nitrospira defluvii]|uniref:Uncharacterized protein n=1 Tax=Nitrospira defluvii TaxID=330214 RepID=A0ABM8R7H0_9BACT|nr:hypothetical protein NSPZN2_110059 [Nitrospira defluvii]